MTPAESRVRAYVKLQGLTVETWKSQAGEVFECFLPFGVTDKWDGKCLWLQQGGGNDHDWDQIFESLAGKGESGLASPREIAEECLRTHAAAAGVSYEKFMLQLAEWLDDVTNHSADKSLAGEFDIDLPFGDSKEEREQFWAQYETVTGTKVLDHDWHPFECAC